MNEKYILNHAKIQDIKQIQNLINHYATKGEMLPRSLNDLYEGIRNFWVLKLNNKVIGVCALQIAWENLAEIKSLAVLPGYTSKGYGRLLVQKCINEAKELGVQKVFALTYKPGFFSKFGFVKIPRSKLPHKVWNECIRCVKYPNCDENAMILLLK